MPIYEYECVACGNRFERLEKMGGVTSKRCPGCGAESRRMISAGGSHVVKGRIGSSKESRSRENCDWEKPCCGREVPCTDKPCR